ncbi:MAG: hypothetical protein KC583_12215 [Myxococcales bacterium]|nr:hypothetical protein [Myxococcales bacterium]
MALALALALTGCDDSSDDDGGGGGGGADMGGGGGNADMGVGGEAQTQTYAFSTLTLEKPSNVGGLLTNLLRQSLQQKDIIVLMQIEGWDSGDALVVRGGAAQLVTGADTTDDPDDDTYGWLTMGMCIDANEMLAPCEAPVGETTGTQTGDMFTIEPTVLNIYAQDLSIIIPIKHVVLEGTSDGIDVSATLSGVVTQADAENIRFELVPVSGNFTDLETVLGVAEPDRMVDDGAGNMVPAYTFEGTFEATLVTHADE